MIEIVGVSRNYGTKLAVDDLSLTIPAGELFVFLGPNGAGKTTTIRMLVGLLQPSSGNIYICGYDSIADTRFANASMAYVPDEPYLYDKLTGREFLKFISEMYALSNDESTKSIEQVIELFELHEFIDELAEKYSHGMKQRTAFAAALLHNPRVLVVDEPMVGLDPRSARLVKDLLRQRVSEGMTVFMSTHTLSAAEEIADRIAIFDHGRIAFLGTLDQLRQRHSKGDLTLEQMYLDMIATQKI